MVFLYVIISLYNNNSNIMTNAIKNSQATGDLHGLSLSGFANALQIETGYKTITGCLNNLNAAVEQPKAKRSNGLRNS